MFVRPGLALSFFLFSLSFLTAASDNPVPTPNFLSFPVMLAQLASLAMEDGPGRVLTQAGERDSHQSILLA